MISSFYTVLLTTNFSEMILGLRKWHIPYSVAFAIGLIFQIIPITIKELQAIMDAQSSRGLEIDKCGWATKVKNYVTFSFPLLFASITISFPPPFSPEESSVSGRSCPKLSPSVESSPSPSSKGSFSLEKGYWTGGPAPNFFRSLTQPFPGFVPAFLSLFNDKIVSPEMSAGRGPAALRQPANQILFKRMRRILPARGFGCIYSRLQPSIPRFRQYIPQLPL